MIITCKKPFKLIKPELERKVTLIACDLCARRCETGGEKGLKEMEERLISEGFEVVDKYLIPGVCNLEQLKNVNPKGDCILVLACSAGAEACRKIFNKKVIEGTYTLGIGYFDSNNLYLVKDVK